MMNITAAKNELALFDVIFDEVIEETKDRLIQVLELENGATVYEDYRFTDNHYVKKVEYSFNGDSCSWEQYGERW